MKQDYKIEERSSPVCMGVQRRIVSAAGSKGPWVCGTMSEVWKAYKKARKDSVELAKKHESVLELQDFFKDVVSYVN